VLPISFNISVLIAALVKASPVQDALNLHRIELLASFVDLPFRMVAHLASKIGGLKPH